MDTLPEALPYNVWRICGVPKALEKHKLLANTPLYAVARDPLLFRQENDQYALSLQYLHNQSNWVSQHEPH